MFNEYLDKAFIINIAELQILINFTDLKISTINYKALISMNHFKKVKFMLLTTIYMQSLSIKSSSKLKMIFHKDEEESFAEIKNIKII